KETMAAALVLLSRWKGGDRPLLDPMCGTGTIAIEAAMIARNVAPGVNRNFASEKWDIIPENLWIDLRDEAFSREDYDKEVKIYASDIDSETVEVAKLNAIRAGVEEEIEFKCMNFLELETMAEKGCIVSNPPYGDRLLDEEAVERLYGLMGDIFQMRFPKWSYYIITSYENFEKVFGKKATKNRKLYNGGIKCHYYQYYGAR
ncbi:MAG: THUMP domain-containing class I SAM-dependent RNA methyltransferase, partial [Cetobacterium sp.]